MDLRAANAKARPAEEVAQLLRSAQHVAIVRLGSIGDVVATLPIAWFLRDLVGDDVRLSWIAHGGSTPLLEDVGALDSVIALPRGSLFKAVPTWKRILRQHNVDAVVDLHGNLKSGVVDVLCGARIRLGFHRGDCREHWNPLFTNYKLPKLSSGNKTRRAIEFADWLGLPDTTPRFGLNARAAERERAGEALRGIDLETERVVVLQLSRLEDVRGWPAERFGALAVRLLNAGARVLVCGGPDEITSGEEVRKHLPSAHDRLRFEVGTLSLAEISAVLQLLAQSPAPGHAFVGGDSGCLHIAAATGLRCVALFGPQDPDRTAPIGEHVTVAYHPEVASCIPCSRRECDHSTWSYCMKSIAVDEVATELSTAVRSATKLDERPKSTAIGGLGKPSDARQTDGAGTGVAIPAEAHHDASRRQGALETNAPPAPASKRLSLAAVLQTRDLLIATALILTAVRLRAIATAQSAPDIAQFAGDGFAGVAALARGLVDATPRLASAIASILAVVSGVLTSLLTYLFARRTGSQAAGILSASLLTTTLLFLNAAAQPAAALTFVALVQSSFFFYLKGQAVNAQARRGAAPLSLMMALGAFLLGGVGGWILPAVGIATFHAGEKSLHHLLRRGTVIAVLVAIGVTLLWHLTVTHALAPRLGGNISHHLFWPLSSPNQLSSWRDLACASLPLSLLAPFALFAHLKNRRFREDLGFADRRWRFAKSTFLGASALLLLTTTSEPMLWLATLPSLCVLISAWIERRIESGQESQALALFLVWSRRLLTAAALAALLAPLATGTAELTRVSWWLLAAAFAIAVVMPRRAPDVTCRWAPTALYVAIILAAL